MSNALVASNLPAHLAALVNNSALSSLNQDAVKGISTGSWPRISLKGGYFRLQDPQGQEVVVPERHLDVVIVAVNPHGLSKIYYAGAYDPAGDGTGPDCYSDNGVAPSARAAKPQCGTCAACPHNAWGSKITPSGAQVKACADVKKVAVLLAANTGGPVFELRIPAASLSNLGAYVRGLDAAGIPAASVITRMSFDTASDYPKLLFGTPVLQEGQSPYITQDMLADVMDVVGSAEVKQATGENDRPRDAQAQVNVGVFPPVAQGNAYGPVRAPLHAAQFVPTPLVASLPPAPPAHIPGPPLHPAQVGPTPPVNPNFPHSGQTAANAQQAAGEQAPAKRTRTRKADSAATGQQQNAAQVSQNHLPLPPFLRSQPQATNQARDATAPVSVNVTDSRMDDMLAAAMRT